MSSIRQAKPWMIGSGLLIIAMVSLRIWVAGTSPDESSNDPTTTVPENAVTVVPAEQLLYYPERSAPAEVVALNQSRIPARIASVVSEMSVRVGDRVEQGDRLATLDCREYQQLEAAESARVQELTARLAFDQRELDRGEVLARQKSISEALVDQRVTTERSTRAQLAAQQSALERASLNVEHCELKAPFAGVIVERLGNVGEMVTPGTDLYELLQLDRSEVIARVSLTDIESFDQAARYILSRGELSAELDLRQVLPVIDGQSQSRRAVLTLKPGLDHSAVVSGVTGRIVWTSSKSHLPAHLLQIRDGEAGVFVIESNPTQSIARFVPVPMAQEGRPIPISLSADQAVVLQGRFGLHDGEPVSIRDDQPETQP